MRFNAHLQIAINTRKKIARSYPSGYFLISLSALLSIYVYVYLATIYSAS